MKRTFVAIITIACLGALLGACGGGGGGGGGVFLPAPAKSSAKAITAYSFASPAATGTIDEGAKTISVTVPFGTNVTALVATFTTTGASVKVDTTVQVSGTTPNDFTSSVEYLVTAADNSTATYTVTVTVAPNTAKAITAFSFTSPAATGTIDEGAKTISVTVPFGTNVTALKATFTTTGASVKVDTTVQVSGTTPNDFTNPVPYIVTAADGLTETYTVTVIVVAIDLPKTGQTASSSSGDDGALQKGVAWPSPRFMDNTDGTVTDNLTGLMWLKNANCITTSYAAFDTDGTAGDGRVAWQHALDFVAGINAGTYSNCGGGKTGWRLPNRKELRSLADYSKYNPSLLTGHPFANAQASFYWSSTTYAANTAFAWYVNMYVGFVMAHDKTNYDYVWPVNDAAVTSTISLPTTGQTSTFASGDDGALQKGVAWPGTRFMTNADTTVTDNLTGLVWAPNGNIMPVRDNNWDQDGTANDGAVTWQHALDYIAKLNTESYLGYNDWRLPNVNELESLVHAEYENNAAWLNTQGFTNVLPVYYWSSTTDAASISDAWSVSMSVGLMYISIKALNEPYVWPVRGGQ